MKLSLAAVALMCLPSSSLAFAPSSQSALNAQSAYPRRNGSITSSSLESSAAMSLPDKNNNYWVPFEKVKFPIFKMGKGAKQKVLNLHGLLVVAASLITMPIWIMALSLEQLYMKINKKWDENRVIFDRTGKIWAKAWLKLTRSYPTQSGNVEMLKGDGIGPCLYVANHGSWLDIPIVCTVLEPVFKFIAKGDLKNVPGIGQQLRGVCGTLMSTKKVNFFS